MAKPKVLAILLSLIWHTALCQPLCHTFFYDEDDGLPHSHITQLLQDKHGFLWLSTWNGLCRYDGYDFQTFKPQPGDGSTMATDRLRDISLLPSGNILCRVDNNYYLFDTRESRFSDLDAPNLGKAPQLMTQYRQSQSLAKGNGITWKDRWGTQWTLASDGTLSYKSSGGISTPYPLPRPIIHPKFACHDSSGNLWVICESGLCRLSTDKERAERIPQEEASEVKCMFTDRSHRIWVCTKEDRTVRLFSQTDGHLIGYLSAGGTLQPGYTRFTASIYSIHQSPDGTIWLGSKPDGIFRLNETSPGHFTVQHITQLPDPNVYSITTDSYGRLWVATLGGGVCYSEDSGSPTPSFIRPAHYPSDGTCLRARFLHITPDNILTIATTDGFLVSRLESEVSKMTFTLHTRDPHRTTSLSSGATMNIVSDNKSHIYISTESGGINVISRQDLLKKHPSFHHINASTHQLPSDVTQSITPLPDGSKMIVGSHSVSIINSKDENVRVLDASFFNNSYRFSDAIPQAFADGRWLLGLADGAITITSKQINHKVAAPRLVLTGATVQGVAGHWGAEWSDSIIMLPHERNITLHFAAIDYTSSQQANYAFRLLDDDSGSMEWNNIGHDRSVTLLDLSPGTHVIEIRCSDSGGQWTNDIKRVTLVVKPTFWQSWLGHLLLCLIIMSAVGLVAYTYFYIRRIKRQQHETLEAYLSLLNNTPNTETPSHTQDTTKTDAPKAHIAPEDDAMIKRLMAFIDENLNNSELRVADMASAAATSPSGLQRKLKQAMGITPQDLLREARIKHACQLLDQSDMLIADIAYSCGFSDPKYFSRCFKASVGKSPKEYKNSL